MLTVGDKVYLQVDCGDYWKGRCVVIPPGQPGIVKDLYVRQGVDMVMVDLIDSPGRPRLESWVSDRMWGAAPPTPPPAPPSEPTPGRQGRYRFLGEI